jgi:hypothetical protein
LRLGLGVQPREVAWRGREHAGGEGEHDWCGERGQHGDPPGGAAVGASADGVCEPEQKRKPEATQDMGPHSTPTAGWRPTVGVRSSGVTLPDLLRPSTRDEAGVSARRAARPA